jgi:Protein of unknown function (DUF3638)/Protein of unknown function (DUF3645)
MYDNGVALRLSDELERCKLFNGAFIVTPQHRLSLLLKQHEHDICLPEDAVNCFHDILDESDAILSHEFQLVYALGSQQALPNGRSRWQVLNALLLLLSRSKNRDIAVIVHDDQVTSREQSHYGTFPKLRFLSSFKDREQQLGAALCKQLLSEPPYELRWMQQMTTNDKEVLARIMSDPEYKDALLSIRVNPLFEKNQADILAARGLIAHGILFHGLQTRYRVNYGLLPETAIKLAVPYSASDTPKPRTQYSHPDMCLVYTALSYLHEGLTMHQVRESLLYLQNELGPVAQEEIYRGFIDAIRNDVDPNELGRFDNPSKVDVNNVRQFELIYKSMKHCMEVIFFWTDNFVYPTETQQFSRKLATNSWHVCDKKTNGFSGTDDNRFLLPATVDQITPVEDHLRATNGE